MSLTIDVKQALAPLFYTQIVQSLFYLNLKFHNLLWLYSQICVGPGPEVIKLLSCSTRLRSKFILLINVKMPTIVGILTFMSRINDWLL